MDSDDDALSDGENLKICNNTNDIIVSASRIPPGPVITFLNTVGSSFLICGAGCMLKLVAYI